MAKGRMISNSISTSRRLSRVKIFDALLFTWIITHCDDYGRMEAEPQIIKGTVVPLRPESEKDVEKSLENLSKIGLIFLYEMNGDKYLEIVKWEDHQTFRSDRPRVVKYPPSPSQIQVGMTLGIPLSAKKPQIDAEVKLSQVKLSQRKMLAQSFELFYETYPRKVSKQKSLLIWNKINPDELLQAIIMVALQNHKESEQWMKDDSKFIPHPTTWLNQARWEEVMPKAKVGAGKKPYYKNFPMIKKFNKWYVIEMGGEMLFTGSEDDIIYK